MSDDMKKIEMALNSLVGETKTLFISVPGETESLAEIGVCPFIQKAGHLYIYASRLSAHIRMLLQQKNAVFMMIADESRSKNIWARHRLKFTAKVCEISRDDKIFSPVCDEIGAAHGPVIHLIRDFTDFHLFQITPETGVFVSGFGSAYSVSGPAFLLGEKLRKS